MKMALHLEPSMRHSHMRAWSLQLVVALLFFGAGPSAMSQTSVSLLLRQPTPADQISSFNRYGALPLSFEANMGQTDSQVRFLSRVGEFRLFLTDRGAVLAIDRGTDAAMPGPVFQMRLLGANSEAQITGLGQLPGTANYFVGNDPAKWRSSVPTFATVNYAAVYPGIDLKYYGSRRQLEYDFVVAAGADPNKIRLQFGGATHLRLMKDGSLDVVGKNGTIRFNTPLAYQDRGVQRQTVEASYQIAADHSVRFRTVGFDRSLPLVIDPVLVYSTYLGGAGGNANGDRANAIAVDSLGNAYVAGSTFSANFPLSDPIQGGLDSATEGNAFVSKFNAEGTALIYSTYLGGNGGLWYPGDTALGIAVDAAGEAYVVGEALSSNFPTVKPLQPKLKSTNGNGFVTKINSTGSALVFSTYLGGSGSDGERAHSVALDPDGDAYVAGSTGSTDFPTVNAFQKDKPSSGDTPSAFVSKIKSDGSELVYSTYLGGSGGDGAFAIAVDKDGDAYVAGNAGLGFPTVNPFQSTMKAFGAYNVFISKFNPAGSALVYSTYLGGSGYYGDSAAGIALDSKGSAYVTGQTSSNDFPVVHPIQSQNKSGLSVFVSKIDPSGSALVYSTYLGGSAPNGDFPGGIAVDPDGNAFVDGSTFSKDFPLVNPIQNKLKGGLGSASAYITEVNAAGTAFLFSTFLGGSSSDEASAIGVDSDGNAYIAGWASSPDFPTKNPFQGTLGGLYDAFVAKINLPIPPVDTSTTLTGSVIPQIIGKPVTFTAQVSANFGSSTPNGNLTFSVDGTKEVTETLNHGGSATFTTASLKAGRHTIVAGFSGNVSFASSTSPSLTETIQKPQTITFTAPKTPVTYGVKPIALSATSSSGLPVAFSVISGPAKANGRALTITGTGIVVIAANQPGNSEFAAAREIKQEITVAKAELKVRAANLVMTQGEVVPTLKYVIDGFVLGDTQSSATTGIPKLTTTATSKSKPGYYPIEVAAGTLAAKNYSFTSDKGQLTIVP